MKIDEFRKQYPQYDDMSDEEVSKNLHKRYYSDMDYESFSKKFNPPSLLERVVPKAKAVVGDISSKPIPSVEKGFQREKDSGTIKFLTAQEKKFFGKAFTEKQLWEAESKADKAFIEQYMPPEYREKIST